MKMSLKNLLIFFVLSALALTATCQVADGEEVRSPFEFEYLVSLRMVFLFENDITRLPESRTAGGVIIGDKWVLTVAHNFDNMDQCEPGRIKIVAGSKNINADERTNGAQIFNVNMAAVTMHPNWRDNQDESYDAALIYLGRESFQMGPRVQPAVLVDENAEIGRDDITIVGWGETENERFPEWAHMGELQIVPSENCVGGVFDKDHHLCYGCTDGNCPMTGRGDSGSPVVKFEDCLDHEGTVIGIHKASYYQDRSVRCRPDTPGIAMDIRKIRGWIRNQSQI